MKIKLNDWQNEVWHDNHRFRIIASGRRSGKSVLSQLIIINWASNKEGIYWIVCPTYRQAKQIHWDQIRRFIPQGLVTSKNEVELSVTLTNGSIIALKGAENPDALRGVKLRGLVIDEIASIRNWDWLWSEALRPTLTDYVSPAIFISTPKGYNHFYELYELGQAESNDYKSWRFTSYDNPYIPKEEIDAAKEELTEETFAQEYLADFKRATGIALKQWSRDISLIDEFEVPIEWQRGRGFDYGSAHPTSSIRMAVDPDDNWFIERSYNQAKMTIKDHAEAVKAQDYTIGFVPCWGDPSGGQWFTEFKQYNLDIEPANKEVGQNVRGWVEHTIEVVNERLKPRPGHVVRLPGGKEIKDAPRLFVLNTEENQDLVKQIENLKWRVSKVSDEVLPALDESDDPTKGHYDLVAALRYLAVSYKKTKPWEPSDPGGVKPYHDGLPG